MGTSVWGGFVLALLGSGILYYVWPRESERIKEIEEQREKSDLETTAVMLLKAYLDERREKRELKRLNQNYIATPISQSEKRSVS
jgi:hypothetical protein